MRKIFVAFLLLFIAFFNSYAQDKIVRTNGKSISCNIQNEDSTTIYFSTFLNEQNINTHLNKSKIRYIKYGKKLPENKKASKNNEYNTKIFGIGVGLEYGGIGVNVLVSPQKNFSLFGGFGYALAGFGYNAGVKLNLAPNSKVCPYFQGMYGYNAAIYFNGLSDYDKLFYGGSAGFGLDFNLNNNSGVFSLGILYPFRKEAVGKYMDYLKEEKGFEFENELYPITVSIGYRF